MNSRFAIWTNPNFYSRADRRGSAKVDLRSGFADGARVVAVGEAFTFGFHLLNPIP
jgi:hypothetical protein